MSLGSRENMVRRAAAQVVAKIAGIEIPRNGWPELVPLLVANANNKERAPPVRQAAIEALGYVCEEVVGYWQFLCLKRVYAGHFQENTQLEQGIIDDMLVTIVKSMATDQDLPMRMYVGSLQDIVDWLMLMIPNCFVQCRHQGSASSVGFCRGEFQGRKGGSYLFHVHLMGECYRCTGTTKPNSSSNQGRDPVR